MGGKAESEMNTVNEMISMLINNKKITEIYINENETDRFVLGYILFCDDEWVLIKCINEYGEEDGYLVISKNDIYRLSNDSIYINDMQYIIDNKITFSCLAINDNNVIEYALKQSSLLAIRLFKSGFDNIYGFVKSKKENNICLECFDDHGNYDGKTCIDINSITSIEFESKKLSFIAKLMKKTDQSGDGSLIDS